METPCNAKKPVQVLPFSETPESLITKKKEKENTGLANKQIFYIETDIPRVLHSKFKKN